MCRWYHFNVRTWRGTKEPPEEGQRRKRKSLFETQHLKNENHDIQSITSWQIEGETVEAVTDFIFLGSKITADGDFSHEIKRHLFLGRKAMTILDSVLKSRDISLWQSYGFSSSHVQIWELDLKKTEHWRIDAFEFWCWRRLLRISWTASPCLLDLETRQL